MVVGQNSAVDAEIIVFSPAYQAHLPWAKTSDNRYCCSQQYLCEATFFSVKKESESMFFVQNHRNVVPIALSQCRNSVCGFQGDDEYLLTVIFCGALDNSRLSMPRYFSYFRILLSSVPDVSTRSVHLPQHSGV